MSFDADKTDLRDEHDECRFEIERLQQQLVAANRELERVRSAASPLVTAVDLLLNQYGAGIPSELFGALDRQVRALPDALTSPAAEPQKPIDILADAYIVNRADGVDGHYCIARRNESGNFAEYYNKGKWCSAGQVFTARPASAPEPEKLTYEQFFELAKEHNITGEYLVSELRKREQPSPAAEAVLSPEVLAFAQLMQQKLNDNASKGGWKYCDMDYLLDRLDDERNELYGVTNHGKPDARKIGEEAADVANFAMMIADNAGALKKPAPVAQSQEGGQ